METRKIGSLDVPTIGLGCNNFGWHIGEAQTQEVVDAALDAGINFFDTADVYGEGQSEEMLGRALSGRRKDVVIASKFGYDRDDGQRGTASYVKEACEASLERLGTDYIDLYYLHKPDPDTPVAETLGALGELKAEGHVREIACSNFSTEQLREAQDANTDADFVAVQNEYSLLERAPEENGVLETTGALGMAFVPYFPLKSGLLTGKYRKDDVPEGSRLNASSDSHFEGMGDDLLTPENLDVVEDLIAFAEARGRTILELAFSWLLSHDAVASVIAGATKPAQIRSNAQAAGWTLTDEERAEVDRITSGRQPA